MRLRTAVILWSGILALIVLIGASWIVIRYDNDPSCASLASTCAFDDAAVLQFGLIGIPAVWALGLAVMFVWRARKPADPKE